MSSPYVVENRTGSVLRQNPEASLGKLDIELTERCNNNCCHCCVNLPVDDMAARQRELTTREWVDIITQASQMSFLDIRFTGGEPLLRDDFLELYLTARKAGLRVVLFTNATLVTDEIADVLSSLPPLLPIEVSVYGMTQRSYESVSRVPGSYQAAWRGINLLLDRNVPFIVKGTALHSQDELKEFEAWAATIPWMKRPPSYSMFFTLRCRRDCLKKSDNIRRLRLSPEDGVAILAEDREFYESNRTFLAGYSSPRGDVLFGCKLGGCVDPYGYLHPCIMTRHPELSYDLRTGSLREGYETFLPSLEQMKVTNQDYLARCARCYLRDLCDQCPAKSYAEHGSLDTPVDYFCEVAHVQARMLGLLEPGEKSWEMDDWRDRIQRFADQDPE